jgi:hypothetical protein
MAQFVIIGIMCIVGVGVGVAVAALLALVFGASRRPFEGTPPASRHPMPEWMCKLVAIVACWLFAVLMARATVVTILTGTYTARHRDILWAEEPVTFLVRLGGCAVAALLFGLIGLGSLGFLPPVGRLYRRLFPRLSAHIAEQRRKRLEQDSAGQR